MRGSSVPHRLLTKLMTCDHKKPNFTVLFLRHIHIVYSFTLLKGKKKPQGGKRGFHSPLFYRGKGTLMLLHFSTSTLLRDTLGCKKIKIAIYQEFRYSPNVSTTPITAMWCRQCLTLSVVQLKGKHCRKADYRNGVVDMFGLCLDPF